MPLTAPCHKCNSANPQWPSYSIAWHTLHFPEAHDSHCLIFIFGNLEAAAQIFDQIVGGHWRCRPVFTLLDFSIKLDES